MNVSWYIMLTGTFFVFSEYKGTFSGAPNTGLELLKPYDLGSMMQYGMYVRTHTLNHASGEGWHR